MNRIYNFSAGPSMLPLEALEVAKEELLSYKGTGMSVMEMSHRSKTYAEIIDKTEELIRELMEIPDNYKVLFLQGGASTQFAMIPLNLMSKYKKADYIDSGAWSDKAAKEASKYGEVNIIASSKDSTYSYFPKDYQLDTDIDYVHITTNNTIYGTKINDLPDTGDIPLVADMSSNILSEKIDVSKFGLIYAGAQKNLGPAGVTIVIIREDLIGNHNEVTPTMLIYKTHADKGSMYNTPPCYSIYMVKLVLEWIKNKGGVIEIEKNNRIKANLLYDFLDKSKLFKGTANVADRSLMNIPFVLPDDDLNAKFIEEAGKRGLQTLKGHRSVGGMRASIYNAMPMEGVQKLVEFMEEFEKKNS
jgi:phosphoserine aminotransferase